MAPCTACGNPDWRDGNGCRWRTVQTKRLEQMGQTGREIDCYWRMGLDFPCQARAWAELQAESNYNFAVQAVVAIGVACLIVWVLAWVVG